MRVEGVPQVLRKFSELSGRAQRAVVRDALRSSARVVAAKAKQRVPVRTGLLRKSITFNVSVKGASQAHALVGYRRKVFYGRFIELGTSKMSAKPFLRPALDESHGEIEAQFVHALNRIIEGKHSHESGVRQFIADVEEAASA